MNILINKIKSISLLLGIVDRILSHPIFAPLSRLSFGTYLSHLIVIYLIFFTRKSVTDWTHFDFVRKTRQSERVNQIFVTLFQLCNGIITIILSNVMSLVVYILLEAPFANLQKLILKSNERKNLDKSLNKLKLREEINNNDNNNRISSANVSHILHITKM